MSVVERFLAERGLPFTNPSPGVVAFQMAGERKKTIGVALATGDAGMRIESFFMRAPNENPGEVYRLLLARNARSRHVWFAVDALGDVYLLGFVPGGAVSEEVLDAVLGELLTTADEMFDAAIERGFATYLAHDLAWRARQQT